MLGSHPRIHGCSPGLDNMFVVVKCEVVVGENEKDEFGNVFRVDF